MAKNRLVNNKISKLALFFVKECKDIYI